MVKSNELLICTSNSLSHVDYGIPLVANKSTDYRTTTGSFHGLVPKVPDDFDCRVKVKLRDDWKYKDLIVRDAAYQTSARESYDKKQSQINACENYQKAPRKDRNYIRTIEEKIFASPPKPMAPKISEMKDNFRMNYIKQNSREVKPPAIIAVCQIKGLGRDEQPPIRPEEEGFWKWLDPYMTTNRCTHINFSKNARENAKKDFPTFYNTNGIWRGFEDVMPPGSGNKSIFDSYTFKNQIPNRVAPKIVPRVPHTGITSEYSAKYQLQTKSDLYPYIQTAGEEYPESQSGASAWQNLAAPGMYCTEYCNINEGKSSRNVIAVDLEKIDIVHKPCSYKFTDRS